MTMLSPGVEIKEKDYSGIIPTVATSSTGIAGRFSRGPMNKPVLISNEDDLVKVFGEPDATNYMEWMCAAEYLKYSSSLWVCRAQPAGVLNATYTGNGFLVDNADTFYGLSDGNKTTTGPFISKNAGITGNDLAIAVIDAGGWTAFKAWAIANKAVFPNKISLHTYFTTEAPNTSLYVSNMVDTPSEAKNDEVHIVILDATGKITGVKYQVLEIFEGLSKCVDALDYRGKTNYAIDVINNTSAYIWMAKFPATTSANSTNLDANQSGGVYISDIETNGYKFANFDFTSANTTYSLYRKLAGGVAGTIPGDTEILKAYGKFANTDLIDVGHIITAGHSVNIIRYAVQSLAATRKDAVAYVSPFNGAAGTPIKDTDTTPETIAVDWKSALNIAEQDSQYMFVDTGYKWCFDRYNRKYRWIPLNGDIAGICSRLNVIAEEWFSPGGFNRGGLRNVDKLAFNPTKDQRDVMYPKGINPVVAFNNQGVVLYGDRMGTLKPSAFDRYNVRRLFIILEKAISIAAKYQLFEFNDQFTRAQFKNMVEPFLRGIQGRRGIVDFFVRCDETNNTGDVIDRNQFVAEIYIKPNRSINTITLTFVATRSDVQFATIIG